MVISCKQYTHTLNAEQLNNYVITSHVTTQSHVQPVKYSRSPAPCWDTTQRTPWTVYWSAPL